MAQVTTRNAVYTEHPSPYQLTTVFNFENNREIYKHTSGYDIAIIEGTTDLPATVKTTLVLDQLLNEYSNIVIGLSGKVDESIAYMLEKANQVVIVTRRLMTECMERDESITRQHLRQVFILKKRVL